MYEPGSQVRMKSDPGRIGVLTNKSRQRGPIVFRLVMFPDGPQYIPEDQLVCDQEILDALELFEKGQLGRSSDLRRNLTHTRLSGRLANLIYSMDTTNTDFYPYQFKPVIRFLESPGSGILIADEVGLGKTIEAGLIWTELRSRIDARRLMVVCRAILRNKWKDELRNRFGVDAEILDARQTLERLQESIRQGSYADFAIIGSLQGLRPPLAWEDAGEDKRLSSGAELARFLKERSYGEPLMDLLIIDEAHYMRNQPTASASLGRLLRHVSVHVLLLSATPVHLSSQDLYQLLNLVDEDTFDHPLVFDAVLDANAPLIAMREEVISPNPDATRLIEIINRARQHPYLSGNRQLLALAEDPPTDELLRDRNFKSELSFRLETMNLLSSVVNRTRKKEVTEWRVLRKAVLEKIELSPPERKFYDGVTALVREFCGQYGKAQGFLVVMPQRQISSSMPAALRDWQRRGAEWSSLDYEEDIGTDEDERGKPGPVVEQIISRINELGDLEELWKNDTKYNRLVKVLREYLRQSPDEKIVLFSYFRPTLEYLQERLTKEGIRVSLIMGGSEFDKDAILENFENPDGPNVLLASEVASEGIDLQFSRIVINYDLPWNPMKVEQRIGRIDRLGQKAPMILIWNIIANDTIDSRIYELLYERLKVFERALGGLEAVLGDEINKLTMDLLGGQLTSEQETQRIDQTAQALVNIRNQEERLEEESAKLIAHGDYILNQVRAARELNRWINGQDLFIYVRDFLQRHYPGGILQQLTTDELVFDIELSNEAKIALRDFLERQRFPEATRLHHASTTPIRCRFENRVKTVQVGRGEIISQFHPLIRFVSDRINHLKEFYYPAVSISLSKATCPNIPEGDYAFSIQRWSVEGIQQRERLCFAATRMDSVDEALTEEDSERLVTTASIQGKDWLAAPSVVDLEKARTMAERCLDRSYHAYQTHITQLQNENNDRADIQEKALDKHLENQIGTLERVKEGHRLQGRDALVKATEARIQRITSRVQMRKTEINDRRNLKHRCDEMCVGIIRLA